MAKMFCALGFKTGAEIGVHRGEYSAILMKHNPDLNLICIDPYSAYYKIDNERRQRRNKDIAHKVLYPYGVKFIYKPSQDALDDVPNGSLDFVFIDGLHDFDNVILDIIGWSRKVRKGGIVSGHDFNFGFGVIDAVKIYAQVHNIYPWYATNDIPTSWFWVRK